MLVTMEALAKNYGNRGKDDALKEAQDRAKYYFQQTDGTFDVPECHPHIKQVLELLLLSTSD
ncbi:MAG: hypothetical protein C9356_15200 [Oleiphilus sp.]|nr:MAG: hypothetical protein C9356_15200 [Oleiphilus sp.]